MKKDNIIALIVWATIISVLAYSIGSGNTIIILLALIVGAFLYMGVP